MLKININALKTRRVETPTLGIYLISMADSLPATPSLDYVHRLRFQLAQLDDLPEAATDEWRSLVDDQLKGLTDAISALDNDQAYDHFGLLASFKPSIASALNQDSGETADAMARRDCLEVWCGLLGRMVKGVRYGMMLGDSPEYDAYLLQVYRVVMRECRDTQSRLDAWDFPEWAVLDQLA